MQRIISLCLLIVGIALLASGIAATESFSSDISRVFTGAPTDKAIWLLLAGLLLSLAGPSGLSFGRSRT